MVVGDDFEVVYKVLVNVFCIFEVMVLFECEVFVIVVCDVVGDMMCFDFLCNEYVNGILKCFVVLCGLDENVVKCVCEVVEILVVVLDYIGVFVFEFFVFEDSMFLVNEFVLWVYNLGYWMLEVCVIG